MNRRATISRNWYGQKEEKKLLVRRCKEDRDELLLKFFSLYPRCGELKNSENVEAILTDVCGFHVVDRPLAAGQLAVCDFGRRIVSVNSDMSFVHHKTNRVFLRWSTLAHELGHIRLHLDEMEEGITISYYGNTGQFTDPRSSQREREADLYAGLFLVPVTCLKKERLIQNLLKNRRARRQMHTGSIWKAVYSLAGLYKVSPSFMKYCLCDLGWIRPVKKKGQNALQLKLY